MLGTVVARRGLVGVAGVLVTACLTLGMLSAPSSADDAPAARASAAPLTVATFNVLSARSGVAWKPRRAKVLQLIKRTRADVIVLQEADVTGSRRLIPVADVKARRLPALWLARRSGLALAASYGYSGVDVKDGLFTSRRGPHILYDPRRLTQVTGLCDTWYFPDTGWATFVDRSTGRPVRVAGVHLARGIGRAASEARAEALDRHENRINGCRNRQMLRDAPTIWAGDFNTTDPSTAKAMRARGVVDSVTIATKRTRHRINTFKGRGRTVIRKGVRIDQVWVPRGSRVLSWTQVADVKKQKYVGRFASDHNPVVTRVVLPG